MTKLVVVVVRDIKADLFGQPFFQASVGMAQRSFSDSVNQPGENNLLFKHPGDFELYHLGTFDDQTATFDLFERPSQLLLGSNCVVSSGSVSS